jgi:hypothetical protein
VATDVEESNYPGNSCRQKGSHEAV